MKQIRLRGRRIFRRFGAQLACLSLVAPLYLLGAFNGAENAFTDLRFRLFQRDASGEIVLVALDGRSLMEIGVWPWPRRNHARVIERLQAAGAAQISLDIDVSARQSPEDDARLAEAFKAARPPVLLPVFDQSSVRPGGQVEVMTNRPLAEFSPYVRTASVTVRPDADSLVRRVETQMEMDSHAISSLSLALAAPTRPVARSFLVDFGIRPQSIPVVSYVDVLTGRFDPRSVAGRTVLIGATAVELGDIVAVPLHRAVPGPALQILAAETIRSSRMMVSAGTGVALLLAAAAALALGYGFTRSDWRRGLGMLALAALALVALGASAHEMLALQLDTMPALLAAAGAYAWSLHAKLKRGQLVRRVASQALLNRANLTRQIVARSHDPILLVGADGRLTSANPSAGRVFGVDTESLVGRSLESLLDLGPQMQAWSGNDQIVGLTKAPVEAGARKGDGSPLTVEVFAFAVDGQSVKSRKGLSSYVVIVHDISARRQAEDALRRALYEAEATSRAKSQFLAVMSHELRTPLNAIIGFSDIMMFERFGAMSMPRYVDYSRDINASAVHLLGVVNDILDVAKVEAGKLELERHPIDVRSVIAEALRIIEPRREAACVELISELGDGPLECLADRARLRQVVLNLVSNAVKFTPSGGRISVSASAAAAGGVTLSVQDTGIGIAPEHIKQVLKPFVQVDSDLNRKFEGSGLGLPIAAAIAEQHGGRLTIESRLGFGTTVELWLPNTEARVSAQEAPQPVKLVRAG